MPSGEAGPAIGDDLQLAVFAADEVTTHRLPGTGAVTIGRADDNDIRIDNPSVSRKHCVLHLGSPLRIEDLGGANGTFVRDPGSAVETNDTQDLRQLSGHTVEIALGDCINLGSTMIMVRRTPAPALAPASEGESGQFVVRDPVMRALYEQARRVAPTLISVLVLGETGVGKEVLAHSIHELSPRAKGPFLALNCAALSASLLESELFGHEKNAFTGAGPARAGLIEAADGGTVFLDEVGDVPTAMQVKLLRVLEERKVLRVGGRTPRPVDVRFVSATNRELEAECSRGAFRQDLFFRLNGMTLTIPPLRERVSEIDPLAVQFVANACRQMDRPTAPTLSAQALRILEQYSWPGNVRELRNVIDRAVALCPGETILSDHLPAKLSGGEPISAREPGVSAVTVPIPDLPTDPQPASGGGEAMEKLKSEMEALERKQILEALERCAGNQTQAAELLGISRRTLVNRLNAHNIRRPRKRT